MRPLKSIAALLLLVMFASACAGEPEPVETTLEEEIVVPEDLVATFDVGYEGPTGAELDAESAADDVEDPPEDLAMTGTSDGAGDSAAGDSSDLYTRQDGSLYVPPTTGDRGTWDTLNIVDESGTIRWSFSDCPGDDRCTHDAIAPLPNGNVIVAQATTASDGRRFDQLLELEPFYGETSTACAGGATYCTGVPWQSGLFELDAESGSVGLTDLRFDADQQAVLATQDGATITIPWR